jgi:hypothetical protein
MRALQSFAELLSSYRASGRPALALGPEAGGGIAGGVPQPGGLQPPGCLAAVSEGGRVLALAFGPGEGSLLFAHPELPSLGQGASPLALKGGPGGHRLRFAPEYAYSWIGEERDLVGFSNYLVQRQEEPGEYRMTASDGAIRLAAEPVLVDRRTGMEVRFAVERVVGLCPRPLDDLPPGVRYAGYESRCAIRLLEAPAGGCVGLWHLLQFPAGSILVVPLRGALPPEPYFNAGSWRVHEHPGAPFFLWPFGGTANAKVGYGSSRVTGRAGVLRPWADREWALVVLDFPVHPGMHYCDAPRPEKAGDQVLQAWDGFGFGELEYHVPAVGQPPLPRQWEESARVWAFAGSPERIVGLALELLGVRIEHLLTGGEP